MTDKIECLEDYGRGDCKGEIVYRPSMSPTGKSYPRCDEHFDARVREQERIVRAYGGRMWY